MTPPLPTFLIIGAMKAGTTSLAYWLGEHPDVFLAPGKELRFFNVPQRWERGIDWYRSQFAGAEGTRAIGEATPGYLGHPQAPERIASIVPGARLIALLRHPADRAYSQYWLNRAIGSETRTFQQLIDEEISGKAPAYGFYLERGRYLKHLNELNEHFPEEAILPLLLDDLSADPAGTFARACAHIGVDDAVRPPNVGKAYNARTALRSRSLHSAVRKLRARRLLSASIAGRLNAWNGTAQRRPYPPMDPAIRATLIAVYEDQISGLEQLLGRDLSSWRE
jgi:hypothetical protein